MHLEQRHFDQLATSKSWKSPIAVIAHIDLDAFYAQCLGVHYNYDPAEPLGCRQWNSLIAVNYPARKYEIKRGMSVDEARRLCPEIHLPHVATFKKGELNWDFHDVPDPDNYKVSLDYFRRESRRIFAIFKTHFHLVEKAGIDEGFVDLGPEVHKEALRRFPELSKESQPDSLLSVSYDALIDIGAELVNAVRLQIHAKLKYTCSAGIAPNKLLAKLASSYKKPFQQTVVHRSNVDEFLSHFKLTDAWGWGGKIGKQVLEMLDIPADVEDQFGYIRDEFTLITLQHALKGEVRLARSLYDMVRGMYVSEVTPRTLIKSMVAVKDFRKLKHLTSKEDVDSWLRVFSADLAGRLADLEDDLGATVVPKTIGVRQIHGGPQSRQQPFILGGLTIEALRSQIYNQSKAIADTFVHIPCTYLVVEISHLKELPKERLQFSIANKTEPEKLDGDSAVKCTREKQEAGLDNDLDDHKEESLFVDDHAKCVKCGRKISENSLPEHMDWHYAKSLQDMERDPLQKRPSSPPSSPSGRRGVNKAKQRQTKHGKDTRDGQKSILEFFKR